MPEPQKSELPVARAPSSSDSSFLWLVRRSTQLARQESQQRTSRQLNVELHNLPVSLHTTDPILLDCVASDHDAVFSRSRHAIEAVAALVAACRSSKPAPSASPRFETAGYPSHDEAHARMKEMLLAYETAC